MSVNVLLLAQLVFSCGGFIKHSSSEDEDLELPLLDQFRNQQLEVRVIEKKHLTIDSLFLYSKCYFFLGMCDIVTALLLTCVRHNFYKKNLIYNIKGQNVVSGNNRYY